MQKSKKQIFIENPKIFYGLPSESIFLRKFHQLQTAVTLLLLNRFQSSWTFSYRKGAETFESDIYNPREYDVGLITMTF